MKNLLIFTATAAMAAGCSTQMTEQGHPLRLQVSDNHRYLMTENGKPFFWLGDTAWLLSSKLNREEAEIYLQDRADKGFNVIQVMVLHALDETNFYGDHALVNENVATPLVTDGDDFSDPQEYDYWDQVDYVIDRAAAKGLYVGLVPVWGSNVKSGGVNVEQAKTYAAWLANRYRQCSNVIWINGGDLRGDTALDIWNAIGQTIDRISPNQLITFHPFGRTSSSLWFQHEDWLDFNMFQSGHRRYDQDDSEWRFGEDNWKYVAHDLALAPSKPTLDGEPSYEAIPQGLHDPMQPCWQDCDVRRYAYWSVFAGACGHTYGNSAVMQFYRPDDKTPAYGAKEYWTVAMDDPGAQQIHHLKDLMLSRPFFERVPDQTLIAGENGEKYDYLAATRGKNYAMIYSYTGRDIPVVMGRIPGAEVKASWFNPRTGKAIAVGEFESSGEHTFDCPGIPKEGNDWVLILDAINTENDGKR